MEYIKDLSITKLTNAGHYQFIKLVSERASADENVLKIAEKFVAELATAFSEEDTYYKLSTKSDYTALINEADSERGVYYMSIKKMIANLGTVGDESVSAAADALNSLIKSYNIHTSMQLDKETAAITNLIQDLTSEKYSAYVEALSLTAMVARLDAANKKVEEYMNARTDEKKAIPTAALATARTASETCYRRLMQIVDTFAIIDGLDNYSDFIDYVNAEIIRYKQQVITKSSTSVNSAEATEAVTE